MFFTKFTLNFWMRQVWSNMSFEDALEVCVPDFGRWEEKAKVPNMFSVWVERVKLDVDPLDGSEVNPFQELDDGVQLARRFPH